MTALKRKSKAARAKLHHLNSIFDFSQYQPGSDGKIFTLLYSIVEFYLVCYSDE